MMTMTTSWVLRRRCLANTLKIDGMLTFKWNRCLVALFHYECFIMKVDWQCHSKKVKRTDAHSQIDLVAIIAEITITESQQLHWVSCEFRKRSSSTGLENNFSRRVIRENILADSDFTMCHTEFSLFDFSIEKYMIISYILLRICMHSWARREASGDFFQWFRQEFLLVTPYAHRTQINSFD